MAFIYKYLDTSARPVYVGKVTGDGLDCLYQRHSAHRKDKWFSQYDGLTCYYCPVPSAADADVLETILISSLSPAENTSKANWGDSSFSSCEQSLEWQELIFPIPRPVIVRDEKKHSFGHCDVCGKQLQSNHTHCAGFHVSTSHETIGYNRYLCEPCSKIALLATHVVFSLIFKDDYRNFIGETVEELLVREV